MCECCASGAKAMQLHAPQAMVAVGRFTTLCGGAPYDKHGCVARSAMNVQSRAQGRDGSKHGCVGQLVLLGVCTLFAFCEICPSWHAPQKSFPNAAQFGV